MTVLIISNCQGNEILKYLNYCSVFQQTYNNQLVIMPHLYNLTSDLPQDIIEFCKKADLFIYQPMSIRRGPFETETDNGIIKYLKESCIKVSFPSLYADIFPIYFEDQWQGKKTIRKIKGVNHIKNLINDGYSKTDIINLYERGDLYFELKERFEYCMKFMEEKEKKCEIKASQFIIDNIKNIRLFDTQNHPTEKLHGFISNQILKYLNFNHEIDYLNLERFTINGDPGKFSFEDSIYMKKELNFNYLSDFNETNYRNILIRYVDNPDNFLVRGIELGS